MDFKNSPKKEINPILNEFDRQNQQGTRREKSLVLSEAVLKKFNTKFIDDGINWDTGVPLDDLENEISMD